MNIEEQQAFREGCKLTKTEEATYLGNTLTSKANATTELDKQMQQVNITMWKLNSYWKGTEANKTWRLLIFDAVIKNKLLYGMETVRLTGAMISKLDAFQMKGLKIILGKKHTHWVLTAQERYHTENCHQDSEVQQKEH